MSNINGTRDQAIAELEMEMARRNEEWAELAKMFLAIGAENADLKEQVQQLEAEAEELSVEAQRLGQRLHKYEG